MRDWVTRDRVNNSFLNVCTLCPSCLLCAFVVNNKTTIDTKFCTKNTRIILLIYQQISTLANQHIKISQRRRGHKEKPPITTSANFHIITSPHQHISTSAHQQISTLTNQQISTSKNQPTISRAFAKALSKP